MGYEPLVLRPTQQDVLNTTFEEYITKHEKRILAAGGICKIVMPAAITPRKAGYEKLDLMIERAIRQEGVGTKGMYRMVYVEQKPMTVAQFKAIAMEPHNLPSSSGAGRSGNTDIEDLERKFWKNVCIKPPLYGADVAGSLWDAKAKGWNLRHLDTVLSRVLEESGHKLAGVNTPYLYFGQWRSVFAWHTEDLDLYSVNYLHFGAPKQWYVIPPEHGKRFEYVIKSQLPECFKDCPEFLRHKELLVSPQFLDQYQIPYVKVIQQPREFVITYPGAYHAGFNHGFNCAESVNFATKRWIPIGARAGVCECIKDSVKIDMRLFRHLVPANQLPDELFEDTTSEEESDSDAGSDSDEDDSSAADSESEQEADSDSEDSKDSTTETLSGHRRVSSRKRSRSQKAREQATSSKRGRTQGAKDVGATGKAKQAAAAQQKQKQQVAAAAAKADAAAKAAAARKQAHAVQQAKVAKAAAEQTEQRRQRAAQRTGRLSVRERLAMRTVAKTTGAPVLTTGPGSPAGANTRTSPRHAAPVTSPPGTNPTVKSAYATRHPGTASAAKPGPQLTGGVTKPSAQPAPGRGARVLQSAAAVLQTAGRPVRNRVPTQKWREALEDDEGVEDVDVAQEAAVDVEESDPTPAPAQSRPQRHAAHVLAHVRQQRAASAEPAAQPPATSRPDRAGSTSTTQPAAAPTDTPKTTQPPAEDGLSNDSGVTLTRALHSDDNTPPPTAPAPAAPASGVSHHLSLRPAVTGLLSVFGIQLPSSNKASAKPQSPPSEEEEEAAAPRRAAAARKVATADAAPTARPKRATAGINRWFLGSKEYEMDDSKWQ